MKKTVILLVLLFFSITGCNHEAEVVEMDVVVDESPSSDPVDDVPVPEPENVKEVIGYSDGEWVSHDEDVPFTLTITGKKVTVNGFEAVCELSEDTKFQYIIFFPKEINDVDEDMFMYFDPIDENNGIIWLPDEAGEFTYQIIISNDKAAEGKEPVSNTGDSDKPSGGNDSLNDSSNGQSEKSCRDVQVLVQEAWDEQVLVKKGACTTVKVRDAWDEEPYCSAYGETTVYVCNGCGLTTTDYPTIRDHITWNHQNGCDGFHNGPGEIYCTAWSPGAHHDAVYEERCEPDVYEIVHHDAVYEWRTVCD